MVLKREIIISEGLVVLTMNSSRELSSELAEAEVFAALRGKSLKLWGSMEIEAFTYGEEWLIIAKPIKVYIPKRLCEFLEHA